MRAATLKSKHNKLLAAIHIAWEEARRDLRHPSEESRDQRLMFAANVLGLKKLDSMSKLSDDQLGRVFGVLKSGGQRVGPVRDDEQPTGGQNVIHLASKEQVWAIGKIVAYLGWSDAGFKNFLADRFKGRPPRMMTPTDAHNCIRVLLNCAASRDLKDGDKSRKISTDEIRAYLPALKKRIGIDQGR